MSDRKLALAVYAACVFVYAVLAGQRLLRPSNDTHFVYQAECFLKRRLDLGRTPPHQNDWAEVETLSLRDGSTLAGQFLRTSPGRFRTLDGRTRAIADSEIAARSRAYYVSFPPFPALLLVPFVAMFGHRTNDVLFTVLLAGVAPALIFWVLRRLPQHLHPRVPLRASSDSGDPLSPEASAPLSLSASLWLTVLFAFGSVYFFCSVLGQVWFTAHVVSLAVCALYLVALLHPLRPALAGLCIGALFLTRPQMAALGLLFLFELLRRHHPDDRYPRSLADLRAIFAARSLGPMAMEAGDSLASAPRRSGLWTSLLSFLVCSGALATFGMVHNILRFGKPLEFGHSFLTTMQADNIQRFGLVNYHYLSRNLATALTLLPKLLPSAPYVQISYHGLALWCTTPAWLFLLWPQPAPTPASASWAVASDNRRVLVWVLAVSCIPIALASLLYQNTGYVQFGYRFSLDYTLPLLVLLALTRREPLGWGFCLCVVWGVLVNLFGALTFSRYWQFYFNGFFPVSF
ncbi:MAG: hypothetical protein JNJ46_09065 [Myxococcales bacterium]|nr:hypothetical protein [Myxococcales bacterium]